MARIPSRGVLNQLLGVLHDLDLFALQAQVVAYLESVGVAPVRICDRHHVGAHDLVGDVGNRVVGGVQGVAVDLDLLGLEHPLNAQPALVVLVLWADHALDQSVGTLVLVVTERKEWDVRKIALRGSDVQKPVRTSIQCHADLKRDGFADLHQPSSHCLNVPRVFGIIDNLLGRAHFDHDHVGRHLVPDLVHLDHLAC